MKRIQSNLGFTLVELMIGLAVVGIIMSVTVPALNIAVNNNQSDSLALELESDIVFARNLARTHAITIEMAPISGDWSTGWTIDDSNGVTHRAKGSLSNPKTASGTISSSYSSSAPFTVDARGRITQTGSFSVEVAGCKGKHEHTISINFIGQITKASSSCS